MRYFFWFLLFILVGARIFFYFSSKNEFPDGTKVKISDRVTTEPILYPNSQYFRLSGYKVYLPPYPEINYGDEITVEGVIQENSLKQATLVSIEENKGFLYKLREKLLSFYQRNLPHPHSALVSGMTIGSKAGLGEEFWEILKNSGTAHVVVASGMNVTLVAKFLISVLIVFLPRRKALPFALLGVWAYAVFSGFDAPIIRAAIMGSLTFSAQEIGRIYYASRSLLLSCAGMLLIRPEWVVDLGFILSFAATGSLMLFERIVYRKLQIVPNIIREDFSTSFAAQVGVAPILFLFFGQFNILSPVINALVLWTVVPITIIGILAGVIGMIFELPGRALLLVSYPLTSIFIFIVELFV